MSRDIYHLSSGDVRLEEGLCSMNLIDSVKEGGISDFQTYEQAAEGGEKKGIGSGSMPWNATEVMLSERKSIQILRVEARGVCKFSVSCPHCNTSKEWEVLLNDGLQVFSHCGQVICMLVPTAGGRIAGPASLVKVWWPSEIPLPFGSTEEKCIQSWNAVAQYFDYRFDDHQEEGNTECWLPGSETRQRRVGDCEDHSILLACMLLHLGFKAWMVWEKVDEGSHAWVEVEIDESLRLIEATRKNPPPERLPSVKESAAVYGVSFYKADTDFPARKTGVNCSYFTDGHWWEVSLGEAVSI